MLRAWNKWNKMVEIGKINKLQVVKILEHGIYLDGEHLGEILMPSRYVPENYEIGDSLEVFIYLDSADLLLATTETPYVMVGECAYLKVVDVNPAGAFLDWGLPKDLLVPYGEQISSLQVGKSYTVLVYLDQFFLAILMLVCFGTTTCPGGHHGTSPIYNMRCVSRCFCRRYRLHTPYDRPG